MSTQQYWVAEDDLCTILQEYFNTHFPKNPQRVLHIQKHSTSSGFLCEIESRQNIWPPLFDVVAVNLTTKAARLVASGKKEKSAEHIKAYAIAEFGTEKESFHVVLENTPITSKETERT